MCRRVGESESSRASRARAAVGSPPGQCRQSNYPSASPSSFSHSVSLSTLLSLLPWLSRCPRSHRVSLPFSLFPSPFASLSLSPSFSFSLFLCVLARSRVRFYSLLSRFPLSSILPRSPPRQPPLRFHPVGYSLLLDRSKRRASGLFIRPSFSPFLCSRPFQVD